jgi:hypothetical protein
MVQGEFLPLFLSVILSGIFIMGLILAFINRQYLLSIYGISFLAVVIIWPEVWRGSRFIIPIMPLFIYFSTYLLYNLYNKFRNNVFIYLNKGLIYGLALLLLFITVKNIYGYRELMENYPPDWANYFKAAEWVKNNTPKDCIIADRKSGLFRTASQRECIGFPIVTDPDVIIKSFYDNKVDYVIVPSIPYAFSIIECLIPAVSKNINKFQTVFFVDNPPTYVLKFNRLNKNP